MKSGRFITLALCIPAVLCAQVSPSSPPEMTASRLSSAPVLDGNVLGDDAWRNTEPAREFWQIQPDDGQPASQRTEVFIGFTDSSLYIGVVAYENFRPLRRGDGYGVPTPGMNSAVLLLARLEGILADPVYSGKGLAGMIDLVSSGYFGAAENIVFLHTGGSAALFAYREQLNLNA